MRAYRRSKIRSTAQLLALLKRSAKKHTNGYSQYTTLSALSGMVESEMLHLSSKRRMNDLGETMNDRMYVASFCFGQCENLAIWCLYGVPNKEAVRVTFSHQAIVEWLESLRDKDGIGVYSVSKNGYKPINAAIRRILFADVAYRGQNTLRHIYDVYSLSEDESNQDERLDGITKDYAWFYENEVRLIVEFCKPLVDESGKRIDTIAIEFEDPVESIKDGTSTLMLGPWSTHKLSKGLHRIPGHILHFTVSDLQKLVRCRCNDAAAYKRFHSTKKEKKNVLGGVSP